MGALDGQTDAAGVGWTETEKQRGREGGLASKVCRSMKGRQKCQQKASMSITAVDSQPPLHWGAQECNSQKDKSRHGTHCGGSLCLSTSHNLESPSKSVLIMKCLYQTSLWTCLLGDYLKLTDVGGASPL